MINREFADALRNPKRYADADGAQGARLFPYYAGYSSAFAGTLLASLNLPRQSCILDPWNGSGVTTNTARRFGYKAVGRDLNPAMVLISKAEQIDVQYVGRLLPIAHRMIIRAKNQRFTRRENEPLQEWIVPRTAWVIRSIEREIQRTLMRRNGEAPPRREGPLREQPKALIRLGQCADRLDCRVGSPDRLGGASRRKARVGYTDVCVLALDRALETLAARLLHRDVAVAIWTVRRRVK